MASICHDTTFKLSQCNTTESALARLAVAPSGAQGNNPTVARILYRHQVCRSDLGTWTLDEFSDSLRSIGDIYGLRAVLAIEQQGRDADESFSGVPFGLRRLPPHLQKAPSRKLGIIFPVFHPLINPRNPTEALRVLEPGERLYVKRIQFASPGFTDLAGLGTIVGHVKDFLFKLIDLCTTTKQREHENEKRKLENDQMRIENIRNFASVAKDIGYTSAEMRLIVRAFFDKQAPLIPLIEEGKIHGVRVLTEEEVAKV